MIQVMPNFSRLMNMERRKALQRSLGRGADRPVNGSPRKRGNRRAALRQQVTLLFQVPTGNRTLGRGVAVRAPDTRQG